MTAAVYAGFQTLMIQVLGAGILEFCKILNDFPEILVKIYKIFWETDEISQAHQASWLSSIGAGWQGAPPKEILPFPPKKRKKHPFLKNTSQNF